jgi:glycine/D-amino acid oxidase-like deaminating enzyme
MHYLDALKDAAVRPLWHDPDVMPEPLAPLTSEETCELLIVGGGFTGLWAAMQAKERKPDADIILIEQTFIGDGASGRNGGFLSSTLAHTETNTEYRFADEAERLAELGIQNMREFLETLERYNIDARYEKTGEMYVALDPESAVRLHAQYREAIAEGDDVVWFDKDAVREQVNSPTFFAGLWERGGQNF